MRKTGLAARAINYVSRLGSPRLNTQMSGTKALTDRRGGDTLGVASENCAEVNNLIVTGPYFNQLNARN